MSLVRTVLRIATVRALVGATPAAERVFDSAVAPIDPSQLATDRTPVLVVYTDAADAAVTGKDMLTTENEMTVVLQCAVASKVDVVAGDARIEIPHTDPAMEIVLDLMASDALITLQVSTDPWAELWRHLVMDVKQITARRGAAVTKGLRSAAQEITIIVNPIGEPFALDPADAKLAPAWALADQLFREDPDLVPIADIIAARIGVTTGIADWKEIKGRLGITALGLFNAGLGPLEDVNEETPPATEMNAVAQP